MNFTCLILGISFILAGILFAKGKILVHIDAWRNMPIEEKENILIIPLCRNIGLMIALCGLLFFVSGIYQVFRENIFVYSMVVWFILAFIDLYWIDKRKKYQIQK